MSVWADSVAQGHPPEHLAGLVEAYAKRFPKEARPAVMTYLATTYGATLQPGGFDPKAPDAPEALKALADAVLSRAGGPILTSPDLLEELGVDEVTGDP